MSEEHPERTPSLPLLLLAAGAMVTMTTGLSLWAVQSNYADLRDQRHWMQGKVEELRALILTATAESRTIARDQYNQLREDLGRGRDELGSISGRIAALEGRVTLAIQASADRDALLAEQDSTMARAREVELARVWEALNRERLPMQWAVPTEPGPR